MCLSRKSNKLKEKYSKKRIGWKVFIHKENRKHLAGFVYNRRSSYTINKWLNEKKFRELHNNYDVIGYARVTYETGWHIFLTKGDAITYVKKSFMKDNKTVVVKKVKFRRPCAYGYQNTLKVVVAKEMLIEE